MAHPCTYYVKFLLAQTWGDPEVLETTESINNTMAAYGLPSLFDSHFDGIRSGFSPPPGFKFNSRRNADTLEFMKREKISSFWTPTLDDKRVLVDILDGNQQYRHKIHVLLMGSVPFKVIADKINNMYAINPPLTERMVATYHHYFWNVGLARQDEWDELLRGFKYKDTYMAALHCGDQQALYRAGFRPKVPIKSSLRDLHRQVHFRLETLYYWPDNSATFNALSSLGLRMENLYEILSAEGAGAEDQLARLRTILLKHKVANVETIDSWIDKAAGGSISNDGSDREEREEENEDENSNSVEEGDQDDNE